MQGRRQHRHLAAVLTLSFGIATLGVPLHAEENKTITDLCGHKVEVPISPKKIATMHCVSAEKIMTLGRGDSLALMAEQSPWAYKLFPEIGKAQSNAKMAPEQIIDMGVDFVLYTPGMTKSEPYSAVGLKPVCAFSAELRPMTIDDFVTSFQGQVSFFGELLGGDAKVRADKYNAYFAKKVNEIRALTSKIDPSKRPRVYYGGLRSNLLNGQGRGSVMHWITEIAGGNYLPEVLDDNHATATVQQVVSWDPDVIFVSGLSSTPDLAAKDASLASLRAVKNGKVYHIPMGVYAWDHASNEGVLLMIYMAKTLHPDLFKQWNMIKEMKTFYADIYGKQLTDQEAQRILDHLPPS